VPAVATVEIVVDHVLDHRLEEAVLLLVLLADRGKLEGNEGEFQAAILPYAAYGVSHVVAIA